jgi:RNA polymerase sigma-70 factor (ECF subfamily)
MSDRNPNSAQSHDKVTPEFITQVREQMLAFAQLQLGCSHLAEDVVQDALLAALQNDAQFKGDATFKSWVFGILKNKIVDHIRKDSKYVSFSALQNLQENGEDIVLDTLFNDTGFWHKDCMPSRFNHSWSNPEVHVQNEGFWEVLEVCLTHLPSDQARAFLMREYMELDTEEICQEMVISSNHYYVLMHRARLRLQTCLTQRWFQVNAMR